MSIEKKQKLIEEFFSYKDLRRRPRHTVEENSIEEPVEVEDPEELKSQWLDWMNARHVVFSHDEMII